MGEHGKMEIPSAGPAPDTEGNPMDSPTNETEGAAGTPLPEGLSEHFGGKFDSVEALAESYNQAQQHITEIGQQTPPEPTGGDSGQSFIPTETLDGIRARFLESGEVGSDDRTTLQQAGIPDALIDEYQSGLQALGHLYRDQVLGEFGGAEGFTRVSRWAAQALEQGDKETINQALQSGEINQALPAARGLLARYQAAVSDGPPRPGEANSASASKPFGSWQEVQLAMKDQRYWKDPAYQRDVQERMRVTEL